LKIKSKVIHVLKQATRQKDVWVGAGSVPQFLISVLDGGEGSTSRPGRFTPGEKVVGIHWYLLVVSDTKTIAEGM
jgi:hypothetical protein